MTFKGKRVLITAGPTWVPIDNVRVISNIATGETGVLLAERLAALGAKVTLLLGPVELSHSFSARRWIKLIRFRFFEELKRLIVKELTSKKYDMVIHSAAVADYRLKEILKKKIKSDIKKLRLILVPTSKIIDLIKKINPSLFVVGFKFETLTAKKILIREARKLMQRVKIDLAVGNTVHKNKYLAYIIDNYSLTLGPIRSKKDLAEKLINLIRSE